MGLSTWEGLSDDGDKNKNSKNLNTVSEVLNNRTKPEKEKLHDSHQKYNTK